MKYKKVKLGSLILNYDRKRVPMSSREREKHQGNYPYYGATSIMDHVDDYLFDGTYILLGEDGTVINEDGRPILQIASGKFWVNNHAHVLQNTKDIDFYYLYYLLKNTNVSSAVTGAVQPKISQSNMNNLDVMIFDDIIYQKRVVSVLRDIDDKIEENEHINQNLEQQAQALYLYFFEDNSSIRQATIKDVTLNVTDGVHNTVKDDPNGDYLLLSCKNIKGGHLSIGPNERKINMATFNKLRKRTRLSKGDILISSVGTVGEIMLLNMDPKNYEFQRSVAIVKPDPQIVSSAYLYEALLFQRNELIHTAHGAVQQCLFISDIADFPMGIPDVSDMNKFTDIVTPMFNTITENTAENERLASIRDCLLPKLMSGELDVSALDI